MKSVSTLLMALLLLFATQTYSQETQRQRTINVNGSAEMEVVPNEIYVQVTLREYDKKGEGKKNIDDLKKEFLKAAIAIGIPEKNISLQGFQGYDNNYWWYKKHRKQNPDMKATVTYQLQVENTKKIDELVQKMDDEATQQFFIARVEHSNIDELKKQLKIQAVKDAKTKAGYLSAAIGEQVGEAILINEPNEIHRYPRPLYESAMMKSEVASADVANNQAPEVDFKKIKLKYEVHVVFALK